jgi:hypothetical protein
MMTNATIQSIPVQVVLHNSSDDSISVVGATIREAQVKLENGTFTLIREILFDEGFGLGLMHTLLDKASGAGETVYVFADDGLLHETTLTILNMTSETGQEAIVRSRGERGR